MKKMSTSAEKQNLFTTLKEQLSPFQKSLHEKEGNDLEDSPSEDSLYSIFYKQYKKTPYYVHYPEIMDVNILNKYGVKYHVYKVNNSPHALMNSDICQKLPYIKCKPGYKARWTHNVGSNIIVEGYFMVNEKKIQSIDYRYNDHYNQTMVNPGMRYNINKNLGNHISGDEFKEILPRFETSYKPNWFYSKNVSSFFPLIYCGFFDKIEHHLVLRTKISDLLEIRDVHGRVARFSSDSIASVDNTTNIADDMHLETPQMWGEYVIFSPEQCIAFTHLCNQRSSDVISRNIYYIEDVVVVPQENFAKLGNDYTLELKDVKAPCLRISAVAQNQRALQQKNYSNYSNNSEYSAEGFCPIKTVSLYKGNDPIFRNMPSFRLERVYTENHYSCVPNEPGFISWCFGNDATDSLIAHPGIVFNNGKMVFSLEDSDCTFDGVEEECNDEFKIFVFLTVLRKLKFENFPMEENDRGKTGVSFSVSS